MSGVQFAAAFGIAVFALAVRGREPAPAKPAVPGAALPLVAPEGPTRGIPPDAIEKWPKVGGRETDFVRVEMRGRLTVGRLTAPGHFRFTIQTAGRECVLDLGGSLPLVWWAAVFNGREVVVTGTLDRVASPNRKVYPPTHILASLNDRVTYFDVVRVQTLAAGK